MTVAISPQARQAALGFLQHLLVQKGVDPRAAMAVFGQEGLSGGIGDQGHAFGPGQENDAGGVLTGRLAGQTPEQKNAWAWSNPGLLDLANRVAAVARGQHGGQAVHSIVYGFERPADKAGEQARALTALGAGPFRGDLGIPGGNGASGGLGAAGGTNGAGMDALTALLLNTPTGSPLSTGALSAAFRPQPMPQAPVPHYGDASATPDQHGMTLKFLTRYVKPFGVTITSTTGGQHAEHSYHYAGRAIDVGGSARKLAQVARNALQHAHSFKEMFYTGPGSPGSFVKDGKVYPNSQLDPQVASGHRTHVHLAA